MEQIPLLKDLVIIMAASLPLAIMFHRFGQPAMIGFLITGALIGPYGAGLVTQMEAVDLLAQIGVVLLLFVVGLEFSMARMIRLKREGIIGGGLQVAVTAAIGFLIVWALGYTAEQSFLAGLIIALSSTAIVLKLLTDKGEIDTPQGNLSIGILLFQDLCVVPILIVIQAVGESGNASILSVAKTMALAATGVGIILAASYYIVPRLLNLVVMLRNREVFILTVLLLCFGTAWLTSSFGLSLALGAFIAGFVISESEYSHQIMAEVLTFRDTFLSLFFISIGMLMDVTYFIKNLPQLMTLAFTIMALKVLVVVIVGQALRYPLRLSIVVAIALAQVGEFSFVILRTGKDFSMITEDMYQAMLAASVITMAATPLLINRAGSMALKLASLFRSSTQAQDRLREPAMADHVVIVGYGLNGRNLAKVLKETGINFIINDLNWERIKLSRKEGYKAMYGDSSNAEILKKAGIEKARMMVVAISDAVSTRHIVKMAREENERLYILVRTGYISEVEELYRLGANQVIPEEFETSVEIFSRVLKEYHIPGNVIQNQIDIIRYEGYAMFRTPSLSREKMMEITTLLASSVTETFFVYKDSHLIGKTLVEVDLRKSSGVMVLAVIRNAVTRANPPDDFVIGEGDILALIGSHAQIDKAMQILKGGISLMTKNP